MIHRGENPFRAAKKAGIARTTLLYHLERTPDNAFPGGSNPIIERLHRQIEIMVWKTRMRLIKTLFIKARKTDEKTAAIIWKYLNDSPLPALATAKFAKPLLENATSDDKVTFREFIVERKGKPTDKSPSEESVPADLAETTADTLTEDGDPQALEVPAAADPGVNSAN